MIVKNKKNYLFLLLLGMLSFDCFGQLSQGGIPYSIIERKVIMASENIPIIEMPQIEKEIIEDIKRRDSENECFQFAYGFDVNIDIKNVSLIDTLQYGILYRVGVKSNNAYSINIIFSNYFVPDGAKMFLYNEKQDVILGAYTSNNNKKDQIFATSPISGDKIFIEYFEPRFSEISGQVVIGKVSHDFIGITESYDKTQAGSCEVDVNCIEGEDWQDEKRAVCRLLFNGVYLCSGSLINNVERDGKAYLLTANHCISTQSDASSCVFYFNYEKPDCGFGSGSLSQSISGSYLRAAMSSSDFTLLELSRIPYNSFNPYYAGWDRNETQTAGGVGIHHPQGDVKKISTFNIVPATSDCFFTNNFYKINWIQTINGHGVTEGGSSGSPLFNSQGHIIGQLYGAGLCSNTNCSDPYNDISNYGKFSVSWDSGTSSSTRLKDWLDPNNTVTVLNGITACPSGISVNLNLNNEISSGTYNAANNIIASGNISSNAIVNFKAGNSIQLTAGFSASPGCSFNAKVENCVVVPDGINLVEWTNVVQQDSNLQYDVVNASNYTIQINALSGQLLYKSSGEIHSNKAIVWDSRIETGEYIATIAFKSSDSGEILSNTYKIYVVSDTISTITISKDDINKELSLIEKENKEFDFSVHPNPAGNEFSVVITNAKNMMPYTMEVISSTGELISKLEHCNTDKILYNCQDIPNGFYLVKVTMGKRDSIKKIIINH